MYFDDFVCVLHMNLFYVEPYILKIHKLKAQENLHLYIFLLWNNLSVLKRNLKNIYGFVG